MGRRGMISRGIIVAVVLLVLCLGSASGNEKGKIIRISCPSRSAETVFSREVGRGYEVFIPGNWDAERIILEIDGYERLYLGDEKKEVPAGQETDIRELTGRWIVLCNGKKSKIAEVLIHHGSEIPAIFITVNRNDFSKINRSKNNEITEGRFLYTEADGTVSYDGGITQMKGRGNNTFSYAKKPYQIKLEKKASLSGAPRAKTWVLLANWNDVSLLRNQIMMDMCREMGMRYALTCVQADVWINGIYNGLYLLTEKPQIKKERIDLRDLEEETEELNAPPADEGFSVFRNSTKELPLIRGYRVPAEPEDITGGYLFTIEKYTRLRDYSVPGFRTENGLSIRIKEPTCPGPAQTEYLGRLVNGMHQAVIAEDGKNPVTGKYYTEYIDIDSFALKFLADEWCKNYDFIGGSQYLYKDADSRDPLIYAGPAWDYDLSFGNMRDRGYMPDGDYMTAVSRKNANLNWLLSRHGDFADRVRTIWRERFRPAAAVLLGEKAEEEGSILRSFDGYAEGIRKSAEMNYARWGVGDNTDRSAGKNFSNACEYLKKWITKRTAYMDSVY